ncbi:MAG: transposase [Thaumarchaeota archaeon]|nr:transposase [Nitrososphaerota archaeon]
MKAYKSVMQHTSPNSDLMEMMDVFTRMVNRCIRIGLKENTHNMKRMSGLCYHELRDYDILSSYKICAISRAAGILSNRSQSVRRGRDVRDQVVRKPFITNCYGVKHNGCLLTIPYRRGNPINILLNAHTQKVLADTSMTVQSFSLTENRISICVSKEPDEIECVGTVGIDRNLRNVTCGGAKGVTVYKTNKLVSMKENTIRARAGFSRDDRRKKEQFWKQRQRRLADRTRQYINRISRDIVETATRNKTMILMEDLKGIRKLYRRGNGQGKNYRRRMNGWPFYELQRQIEYKAAWIGLPVGFVNPKRTSTRCPGCGKKLQEDAQRRRKMSCINCGLCMDRDVIAAMNISRKLPIRFGGSRGGIGEAQSDAFESAMPAPRIRIVDMSQSSKTCTR